MKDKRYYIFNNGRLLLCEGADDVVAECPEWLACDGLRLFHETDTHLCYMARSTREDLPEGYVWMDLRESYYHLSRSVYHQAGKASELIYFDCQHHRYDCLILVLDKIFRQRTNNCWQLIFYKI